MNATEELRRLLDERGVEWRAIEIDESYCAIIEQRTKAANSLKVVE